MQAFFVTADALLSNFEDKMNYREVLYHDYSKHFGQVAELDDSMHFAMFDSLYPAMPQTGGIIVDLACGRGAWLRWISQSRTGKLVGVDLSRLDLDAVAVPAAELVNLNIFSFLRDDPRKFVLIHAKDVIEHLTKDEVVEFLTLCRARLVPGGALWVSTFNALAPMAAQTWRGDFTHEMAFTPGSMRQVLRACGFGEIDVVCSHPVPPTIKGRLRRRLMKPITAFCTLVAVLRYGASRELNCQPTLLATARNTAG